MNQPLVPIFSLLCHPQSLLLLLAAAAHGAGIATQSYNANHDALQDLGLHPSVLDVLDVWGFYSNLSPLSGPLQIFFFHLHSGARFGI